MFLRCHTRQKDGKLHRYWSIVETRRCGKRGTVQRPVLYLGEINDSQQAAWRKTIAVLEDGVAAPHSIALFPDDLSFPKTHTMRSSKLFYHPGLCRHSF
jgi:hypothetical protein